VAGASPSTAGERLIRPLQVGVQRFISQILRRQHDADVLIESYDTAASNCPYAAANHL